MGKSSGQNGTIGILRALLGTIHKQISKKAPRELGAFAFGVVIGDFVDDESCG